MTTGQQSPTEADEAPYKWRWLAFAAILAASIMNLLDAMITNIAAPSIRADIGGGLALIQWLGAGYTLALAAGLITGGRLGDIYGRKPVFLIGAVGFTVCSVLCAVSLSPGTLIAARIAQGLFGALLLPQGLGTIRSIFPPRELATAFGAYGPAMGLATVAAPVVAGALISGDLFGTGWRMVFLINVPVGLFVIVAGFRYIPGRQAPSAAGLDVPGALLAGAAALLMIYPVVQGRSLDWPAWCFLLMALSLVLFVVFAKVENRIQARGGDPLVVPTLFRKRAFSGGLVTGLAVYTALTGFGLVFTLFLQLGLGFSPLKAGLSVLPQALGSVSGFVASGAGLTRKLGRRSLHLGTALMAVGAIGILLTVRGVGTDVSPWHTAPALAVYGAGLGLFLAPFFDIVLAGVESHEYGSASGTLTAIQQFGSALGVAVIGTVFFGILGPQVNRATDTPDLRARLAAVQVTGAAQDRIVTGLAGCGHDRATATDPDAVPAGCVRLESDVKAAASMSGDPDGVAAAVRSGATDSFERGFDRTLRRTVRVVVGLLALGFVLAFLLPEHARGHRPPTGGDGGDAGDGGEDEQPREEAALR
ncbi:MFS transporter [Kitasatospora sp. NBC_00240]|uniref:MFS transporter n=1 Tax=Kitasatospora sp. NBC_00240 TaxID=2903567 RepID=UPI0022515C9E|nr:MFS transporter [Kitasatospora sp. NBC_00240]MCX5212777.1 MFS transporter [Kitasatospora sp. NBC_00240]